MSQTYNFIRFYENDDYYGRSLNSIEDLKTYLEDKLFIAVGGGIGSGKTYFINNVLKKVVGNLPVYDVDNWTSNIGGGEYKRELAGKAMTQFKKDFPIAFTKKESFIYTGTNANLNGTIAKLQQAKSNGFTTVLIHIDVPEEVAIKQSQQRSETGERNPIEDYKIIRTNKESKEVFEKVKKDRNLVDFYFSFKR
jgi:predicted ABC-type ATPase